MPGFAHLCPECLDVPTAQCGYRGCPQRALQTSAMPSPPPFAPQVPAYAAQVTAGQAPLAPLQSAVAYRDGSLMVDATRAVTLPAAALQPSPGQVAPAGTAAYGSLPPVADALATRFVDPAALPKTSAMPVPQAPEPPPRRPPPLQGGSGENKP